MEEIQILDNFKCINIIFDIKAKPRFRTLENENKLQD